MPDHMMQPLDVQFGNLEFGFSFGGNESASSAFSGAETNRYGKLGNLSFLLNYMHSGKV